MNVDLAVRYSGSSDESSVSLSSSLIIIGFPIEPNGGINWSSDVVGEIGERGGDSS